MDESFRLILDDPHPGAVNILVVDDDQAVLNAVSMMIASMGFTTQLAKDGLEAVELYKAHASSISLVIMDVEMPRLGGIEAIRKLRDIDPSVKIILCSGHLLRPLPEARPNQFLLKPFLFLELREAIENLLRQAP